MCIINIIYLVIQTPFKTWHKHGTNITENALEALVGKLGIKRDVVFTGPVFEELPCLYNLAELFIFPSHLLLFLCEVSKGCLSVT